MTVEYCWGKPVIFEEQYSIENKTHKILIWYTRFAKPEHNYVWFFCNSLLSLWCLFILIVVTMANQEYSESSSSEEMNWISDWCDEPCNRFFCEVPTAYILDEFNLYGLQQYFDHTYDAALSRILDEDDFSEDAKISEDVIELNAQKLYGMIHARFLTTSQGLRTLRYKVKRKHYGTCPRVLCPEQPLIPCGLTERFGKDTVRLYCPRCEHIYLVNHPSKGCLNLTNLFSY